MNKYQCALKVYSCLQNEETVGEYTPLEYSLAKDDLQELVERATPKKVIKLSEKDHGYTHRCQKCNQLVGTIVTSRNGIFSYIEHDEFCPSCGQALDWSEEE